MKLKALRLNFSKLKNRCLRSLVLVSLVAISACAQLPKVVTANPPTLLDTSDETMPEPLGLEIFSKKISIEPIEQVLSLNEEQKRDFLNWFNHEKNKSVKPYKRINSYLKDRLTHFNYYFDTLTASEALAQNKGNCLSLAIVTKALADLANVDISYQLVETTPVFQKEGDIIVSSQHVRTTLYESEVKKLGGLINIRGRIYIDYFPTYNSHVLRSVDEDEFKSMYYSNKAGETIIQGNDNDTYWYLVESLKLKSNVPRSINMMAVLHQRAGYYDYAERLYKFGIKKADEKLDLLNNYHSLLQLLKRSDDAKKIEDKIGRQNDVNPFKWIGIGNTAYNFKEYNKAIKYYRKASKLAPYLHEPHAGIARSKMRLGKPDQAQKALKRALEQVHDDRTQKLYQAKLKMLSKLLTNNNPVIIDLEQ